MRERSEQKPKAKPKRKSVKREWDGYAILSGKMIKAFGYRKKDCKAYVEEKKYYAGFGHVYDFKIIRVKVEEI